MAFGTFKNQLLLRYSVKPLGFTHHRIMDLLLTRKLKQVLESGVGGSPIEEEESDIYLVQLREGE